MATPDASTAIVAAMPEEVKRLHARLRQIRKLAAPAGLRLVRGELAGAPVLLAVTGEGRVRARQGLAAILRRVSPARLVFVGFSGALSRTLHTGEVVLPARIWDGGVAHEPPDALLSWAGAALGARAAVTLTTDRFLLDAPAKRAHRAGHDDPRAPIVDVESGVWAAMAACAGVPWLTVRAISDAVEDHLPAFLDQCRASDGAIDRGAVIGRALMRPSSWRALWTLRVRSLRCAQALAVAVETLLGRQLTASAAAPP